MVKLTENKVAEINTSALEKRARDIRDAVVTKSVTVEWWAASLQTSLQPAAT